MGPNLSHLKKQRIMTNVEKLKQCLKLGAVRQRMGAENENDDRFDDKINRLSNSQLVASWCGWELGDESWWRIMKSFFDQLEELDKIEAHASTN